jgi:hypothetical protein
VAEFHDRPRFRLPRFWRRDSRPQAERPPIPRAIAFLRFRVDPSETVPQAQSDLALWHELEDREGDLILQIEQAARTFFGEGASAEVTIGRGSVLIEVVVLGYGALKIYREVIENLDWFKAHVQGIIRRFFGPHPVQIAGDAVPSPGLQEVARSVVPLPRDELLVAYLVVSHAALLGVLLWQFVEHI